MADTQHEARIGAAADRIFATCRGQARDNGLIASIIRHHFPPPPQSAADSGTSLAAFMKETAEPQIQPGDVCRWFRCAGGFNYDRVDSIRGYMAQMDDGQFVRLRHLEKVGHVDPNPESESND